MGLIIGLIIGVVIGICITSLAVAAKSKNIFTYADRLAVDTDRLADLIYRADDINADICQADFDDQFDEVIGCKYPGEEKGCIKCIKEWLEKEVTDGEDK
jgi:hypothetical protein